MKFNLYTTPEHDERLQRIGLACEMDYKYIFTHGLILMNDADRLPEPITIGNQLERTVMTTIGLMKIPNTILSCLSTRMEVSKSRVLLTAAFTYKERIISERKMHLDDGRTAMERLKEYLWTLYGVRSPVDWMIGMGDETPNRASKIALLDKGLHPRALNMKREIQTILEKSIGYR